MAQRRKWTLLVVPEGDSSVRQFRIARIWVHLAVGFVIALALYAAVQTYLFWVVASEARQVGPLRAQIVELKGSQAKLQELGEQLTELKSFESQLRRTLLANHSDSLAKPDFEPSMTGQIGPAFSPAGMESWTEGRHMPTLMRGLQEHVFTPSDLPTYPPLRGYVTRSFQRYDERAGHKHLGVDFAARVGTPVVAAASGLVVFADWTYLYGYLVVIMHSSGYVSLYGHNDRLLVSPRQYIEQGQPIALMGNSGRSSAPHLHFEVWRGNEPIDPLTLLAGKGITQ
ncbi:M23 family metallopeptidase [bacterium]|nr:M23 family metallopeptidase [bacterium]